MNVLIIPEDFRQDQYVLKPIVTAMLASLGKPRANVRVCRDPLLHGISQALTWSYIQDILERYRGMTDLFLLCVDRDCEPTRRTALDNLERQAKDLLGISACLLGENAWQEIEVWILAGHDLPSEWSWRKIREHRDPKEAYFAPFAKQRGVELGLGGGRKVLAEEAARRYDRLRRLCLEDLINLETKLGQWLASSGE